MASQLSHQLWQTIKDLRRAYRQAMRFAVQTDPQGSEETSAAWKTVAHRRALLEDTLKAAAPFLGPEPAPVKRPPRSASSIRRKVQPILGRASDGGQTSRSAVPAPPQPVIETGLQAPRAADREGPPSESLDNIGSF